MTHDSRPDTHAHIAEVRGLLLLAVADLTRRAHVHDQSKLESPEVEAFDRVTPRLKELTYGSDEYKASLAEMGEALTHHYQANDHHPEHHASGIKGMNLLQLLEMVCDWMAACKRHPDGSIHKSIDLNAERFGYNNEWRWLLWNTALELERLGAAPRDLELLARYRAAQKHYAGLSVDDAYYGNPPRPDTLEAEKEYNAALRALVRQEE